jgi:hypothetical protein
MIDNILNSMVEHQSKTIEAVVKEGLKRKGYVFETQEQFYDFCRDNIKRNYTSFSTQFFLNEELFLSYYYNTSTIGEERNTIAICYELIFEYEPKI